MFTRRAALITGGLAGAGILAAPAFLRAQSRPIRIGVLGDQTSIGSAASGAGSILTAKMAVADAGGTVLSRPIEVVSADFQNKPDVAVSIARRWFDEEGVSAITDMPISSAALAVQSLATEKRRTMLISTSVSSDLTGKACSPFASQWADDSYTLATSIVQGLGRRTAEAKTWFLIVPDYALGRAIARDATQAITASGSTVLGTARHPVETTDFSSYLLQAQASGASMIGLGNVGENMINTVKQAQEFGLMRGKQSVALFLVYITDIHSLGLETAQGLNVVEGFYWNQSESSRAFGKRFIAETGKMPSKAHAATYAAVAHFLKAVAASGTDEAAPVNARMRETPVDFFGRNGRIREDGRVMFDLSLYRVKAPGQQSKPWDYYEQEQIIPQAIAYRPLDQGGCTIRS